MAYLPSILGKSTIDNLKHNVTGEVIVPGDDHYDTARAAWNLTVNQYPDVILIATNADDIAAGLRFARTSNLGVAVQSTGHGVALPANHGLLIVTSKMTGVLVDPATQTARIEAGVRWHMVLEKAQEVGLAPLLGSSSGVGAFGYTLGGGMGWLARKYGLSVDSVVEFQVVTADGTVRTANEELNSDLYWALRGGGGSFGVVTAMTIKLYPVTAIYGGSLIYPAAVAKEVFTFYRNWIQYLPNEWTTSISIMNFPPLPELPPFLSGQSVVMINGAYSGEVHVGAMMVQPWMDWKEPIVNGFHPMPFSQIDTVSNDPMEPSAGKSTGGWLKDLSSDTIDDLIKLAIGSPILKWDIRYAGGAISNTQNNAFSHRESVHLLQMVTLVPEPEMLPQVEALMADTKQKLAPHLTGGIYMNFVEGKEAREQTRNGFTEEKFARLQEVKAKYDPENIFRFGFNITLKK